MYTETRMQSERHYLTVHVNIRPTLLAKEMRYTTVFATLTRQNEYHTVPYNMLYAENTIIPVSTLPVSVEPLINT